MTTRENYISFMDKYLDAEEQAEKDKIIKLGEWGD